jgi:acetolactate synthase-1/2/3 large subunit
MLFNNNRLGMVRELQQFYCGGRYNQVYLESNPDFSLIAAAYGIEYMKIDTREKIDEAIAQLLNPEKMIIIEFTIDPCANVKPAEEDEQS